jgi:hypothetical protein
MQRQWRWSCYAPGLLALALAPALAGCGPGNGLTLGRVQGKVTYNGAAVKYGTVSFVPDTLKGTNGPLAMGNIKEDGTYVLSTSDPGDGAVVGHHRISIVGLDPAPVPQAEEKAAPNPMESPGDVMKRRAEVLQEGRRAEMRRADPAARGDTFTDRGGRVFRYVVPKKLGTPEESGLAVEVTGGSNTVNFEINQDGTARVVK